MIELEPILRDLCKSQVGCEEKFIEDWHAYNYTVGGKMFAIIGKDKHKKPIISLKCDPGKSEELRREYEAVNPGYYLNKTHWNSIYYNDDEIDVDFISHLIDESYSLVFQSLSKKKQKEFKG